MEKGIRCKECGQRFVLNGNRGTLPEEEQPVTCPKCGCKQEVLWPIDMGWTVSIPGDSDVSKRRS